MLRHREFVKTENMMVEELNGIYWDLGSYECFLPRAENLAAACAVFRQNMTNIVWSSMRTLENNPTSLPQTATILAGQSVSGISIFDLMQVKNYGDGAKKLLQLLREGSSNLSIKNACAIHAFVGKEDALKWGVIRDQNVSLHNIGYVPPTKGLTQIAEKGFDYLNKQVEDPFERAIGAFLFISRNQLFFDANKRCASLMMNGILMKERNFPFAVLNRQSEEFHTKLGKFYETGDANEMMSFFSRMSKDLYSTEENLN